jgi:nucleoside phosphorylase
MLTLVLAAYAPELDGVRSALEPATRMVADSYRFATVGVGLVEATLGAEDIRRRFAGQRYQVLLVGTAGVYRPKVEVSASFQPYVVSASRVVLGAALGEVPGLAGQERTLSWHPPTSLQIANVTVVNTLGITTGDDEALQARGEVEHMESYALARVFAEDAVRVGILLGITNVVGPEGRTMWRAHEAQAMALVASAACAWLSQDTRRLEDLP